MTRLRVGRGRSASAAPQAAPDSAPSGRRPPATMAWTAGGQLATRAVSTVLLASVACGPVALVVVTLGGSEAASAVAAAPAEDFSSRTAVAEFAEHFVLTWVRAGNATVSALSTSNDPLHGVYNGTAQLGRPGPGWSAQDAAVAAIAETSPGTWAVTVGVTVRESAAQDAATGGSRDSESTAPAEGPAAGKPMAAVRRYFAVAVTHDAVGESVVAQTLPAAVPGPSMAPPPRLAYGSEAAAEASAAATGFLAALLTDTGDIDRYTSPGAGIGPIEPIPYTQLRVLTVAAVRGGADVSRSTPRDGSTSRLLLTVELVGRAGERTTAQYPLTLKARAGRWEIASIDPAPSVATPAPG